jgi:hypothetical protein
MTAERPPWDLTFLRAGALVTAALTAVAAPVVGLVSGAPQALGVVVAAVVVTAFFAVSGLAVSWAGRIGDTLTLPVALLGFFVKALVLFAVLDALPADGWLDRPTLAWSVVVGALVWSAVHLRWVWTRQLYYAGPPAPPGRPGGPSQADGDGESAGG